MNSFEDYPDGDRCSICHETVHESDNWMDCLGHLEHRRCHRGLTRQHPRADQEE